MGNNASGQDMYPSGRNEVNLRDLINDVGGGVPLLAVRGAMTYYGSTSLLRTLPVSPGYIGPIAMALTALDVAYVE